MPANASGKSSRYFRRFAADLRDRVRKEEGGGGNCHIVSAILQERYGSPAFWASFLAPNGDLISNAHVINILADGSLLDVTADQFGETDGILLLHADDKSMERYRPEFSVEFHPSQDDEVADWKDVWTGETDDDLMTRLMEERGYGWWLEDPRKLLSYLETQSSFAQHTKDAYYLRWIEQRWEELSHHRFFRQNADCHALSSPSP